MKRRALFLLMATALSCSLAWATEREYCSSRHISLRKPFSWLLNEQTQCCACGLAGR